MSAEVQKKQREEHKPNPTSLPRGCEGYVLTKGNICLREQKRKFVGDFIEVRW